MDRLNRNPRWPLAAHQPGPVGLPWWWTPVLWACRGAFTTLTGALVAFLVCRTWWRECRCAVVRRAAAVWPRHVAPVEGGEPGALQPQSAAA